MRLPKLSKAERDELSGLLDLTAPHLPEMIDVLVRLARTAKRHSLRERAASRVIELHLLAAGQQTEAAKTTGRVVVIQASQLDAVEAAHRKTLNAEVTNNGAP